MTDVEVRQSYIRERKKFMQMQQQKRAELRNQAYAKAKEAAEMVKSKYGIKKVNLFGSTATGMFRIGSDVDMAVEGLADDSLFYDLYEEIQKVVSPFKLDLLLLEEARQGLRNAVIEDGELL